MEAQVTTEQLETQVASEDVTAALSDAQDNTTAIDGALGEVEQETPQVQPEPVRPRTGPELQQAYDAGEPLTSEDRANLRSFQQSEADRARAVQQAREQQRQNAERVKKLRDEFPDRLVSKTQAEINAAIEEGRAISPTLLRNYLKEEADSLLAEIEPAVLLPREANIKGMIYRATQAVGGNAAGVLQYITDNGYTYDQMVELHGELMQKIGEKQAPDAVEAGKLREEVSKLRAEVERLTGERAKNSPGAGGREARGDSRTEDAILLDPSTPIETIDAILARRRG